MIRTRVPLIAAFVLLAAVVGLGWFAWDAANRARDVRSEVYAAHAELRAAHATVQALASLDAGHLPTAGEIESALVSVRAAGVHLDRADARMGYLPTLLPVAGALPAASGAAEVPALLDVGLAVTRSADTLLATVLPLLQDSPDDAPLAERVRRIFVEDAPALEASLAELEALRPEVDRLAAREWGDWLSIAPSALDLLQSALGEVPRATETFTAIRRGFDSLFGFDGPKTYIIAGLNESEIRATGGFLGTVGLVAVEEGRITASDFERVYAWEREFDEYPAPPEDLAITMGAGRWLLRDANWWPDFPTSAESILELFEAHQGISADGVIALNTLFTGQLVEVFAPLDLPEYPEVLTAQNWRGLMERTLLDGREQVGNLPAEEPSAEESYLHPLMEELISRAQSASAEQLPSLFAALATASASRDFQAYVREAPAQAMLDTFGVTGRLEAPPAGPDGAREAVIAVVDSNVSWSKVQPGISRETTVLLGERGHVDIVARWENRVGELDVLTYPRATNYGQVYDRRELRSERRNGVFGNYVRIYLPGDALDVRITGSVMPPRISYERGFTIVGASVVIGDGQEARIGVTYRTEQPVDALTLWKQGGQAHDRLRVLRNADGQQITLHDGAFEADISSSFAP